MNFKHNFKVGDTVIFISDRRNAGVEEFPFNLCYPLPGTIGTILKTGDSTACVQWEKGSTQGNDRWWCDILDIDPLPIEDLEFDFGDITEFLL